MSPLHERVYFLAHQLDPSTFDMVVSLFNSDDQPARFKRTKVQPGTPYYDKARTQIATSNERYHYLVAEITGDYTAIPFPVIFGSQTGGSSYTVDFLKYQGKDLEPFEGICLERTRPDGSIPSQKLRSIQKAFSDNYKMSEGGILYAVGDWGAFLNCMVNWRSPSRTTGNQLWDELLDALEGNGFDRSMIPCMWYGRPLGCLYPGCPYLHCKSDAVALREAVLDRRFKDALKPSELEMIRFVNFQMKSTTIVDDLNASEWEPEELRDFLLDKARIENWFCARPDCLTPGGRSRTAPASCSKCRVAQYCSVDCQKIDQPRHEAVRCRAFHELVNDDSLWDVTGRRTGP